MIRPFLPVLAALALAACTPSRADYCGKTCSLSAPCPTGYSCDGIADACVANDGHCVSSATTGGGVSGTSTGGTTGGTGSSGGMSGGSTGGSTGGTIKPGEGPYSAGATHAEAGALACGGSLSPAQTGTAYSNQGILGSPGAGPLMTGSTYTNQGGFLGQ